MPAEGPNVRSGSSEPCDYAEWDANLLPPRDQEPVREAERDRYRDALEKIAAGPRPDGTYNLSREACEQIARKALDGRS